MERQVELYERIHVLFRRYLDEMPGMEDAYNAMASEAYKGGALDSKTKRLMAMTAAVVAGCRGCILFQAKHALDQGASAEEVLESCAVAISLGGTMAAAETTRVVEYLEETGALKPS
ncbi:carboxymuconolactone decarboxylase family protein [Oceanidesulfovibrio indonesiensis]|uniref:Carboxymuconolactone decarboxylase family protein n=1 Tax=Oceanidesulfovibrio indonesiensis TaxID=54767 RepID=A0A7M3MFQ1_9BACT|nr:carboxymuconolactone decarboxylase family protein [Oceanidesulfovibrio indonesiensis]TVM17938.1 carboxymuconolactone decarboxylase family protein [Oceanidesulfovibrio indonesiensis]